MRLLCKLMAALILIVSCAVDRSVSPLPVQNDSSENATYPIISTNQNSSFGGESQSEFASLVNEIYAIENVDPENKVRDIANHVSNVFNKYGVEDAVDADQIKEVLDKYLFVNSSNSYELWLEILKDRGEISSTEFQYLGDFDSKLSTMLV